MQIKNQFYNSISVQQDTTITSSTSVTVQAQIHRNFKFNFRSCFLVWYKFLITQISAFTTVLNSQEAENGFHTGYEWSQILKHWTRWSFISDAAWWPFVLKMSFLLKSKTFLFWSKSLSMYVVACLRQFFFVWFKLNRSQKQ